MRSTQRIMSKLLSGLVLVALLLLVGLRGGAVALTPEIPLQVEGNRLTGHLSQVTLRTVLEQLQKQLGVKYEAPVGELNKVIGITRSRSMRRDVYNFSM